MPCHGCASKFSLFLKEQSCPNCKFSFCSKCLKDKITINDKNQKVCSTCFKQLSSKESTVPPQQFEPPALLLKRLEALDNPAKPPITVYKYNKKEANFEAGLEPQDREIYERLKKLKESRKTREPPTDEEIRRRLLMLKGLDGNTEEKPQVLIQPRKTEQEQIDDLLNQYMDETNIEEKVKEENNMNLEDLEGRLKNLHGSDNSATKNAPSKSFESEDTDAMTRRILEKTLAEAKLEKEWEESHPKSESDDESLSVESDSDESESNECIICSEDAVVKCLGCDRSLYCQSCYKMGHESPSMKKHKIIKVVKEEISD